MLKTLLANRPKEIFRYSFIGGKLKFDDSFLKPYPYQLKEGYRPGELRTRGINVDIKKGEKHFEHTSLDKNTSNINLLLHTLVAYESIVEPKVEKKLPVEILCHNGLFNDLNLETFDNYNIIYYKNKLIFANTSLREEDDPLLAFVGLNFESILCNKPTPKNSNDQFKILVEGKYGKWPFKSVVEIDSYKQKDDRIDYAEIKLMFIPKITKFDIKRLRPSNKRGFLYFLKNHNKSFPHRVEKWLYQSFFGLQNYLVIGLRDKKFKYLCNEEINVIHDLIPFIKKEYPRMYKDFLNSINNLDKKFNTILKQVQKLQTSEFDVFQFSCANLKVEKIADGSYDKELFDKIVIPEYLSMINDGKDVLLDSEIVDKLDYIDLKATRSNDDN